MAGDDGDDFGGGDEPPRQRRRITPALPQQDDADYSPSIGGLEEQPDEPLMIADPTPDNEGDPPLLPQGGQADETGEP